MGGGLSFDRYLEARHVLVSPRGERGGIVDDALAARGEVRRVVLEVQHFLVAPLVVASSDLLLTLPARLAEILAKTSDLAIADLPLDTPAIDLAQLWQERDHDDAAHAWLRHEVAATARGLARG